MSSPHPVIPITLMAIACSACGTAHRIPEDAGSGNTSDADADGGVDAFVPRDAETPMENQFPPDQRCDCSGPNAEVAGSTPSGPVLFRYAFIGNAFWGGLDCWDLVMLFSPEQTVVGRWTHGFDYGGLVVTIHRTSNIDVVTGLPLPVDVTLNGDRSVEGTVLFEELVENPPAASGTLEIRVEGWEIEGSFEAVHCPLLDDNCL